MKLQDNNFDELFYLHKKTSHELTKIKGTVILIRAENLCIDNENGLSIKCYATIFDDKKEIIWKHGYIFDSLKLGRENSPKNYFENNGFLLDEELRGAIHFFVEKIKRDFSIIQESEKSSLAQQ